MAVDDPVPPDASPVWRAYVQAIALAEIAELGKDPVWALKA